MLFIYVRDLEESRRTIEVVHVLEHLTNMTFDGLCWEEITALDFLQAIYIELPVLVVPRWQGDYTVYKDASDEQISCTVLQKKQNGTNRQIQYWSILLIHTEKAYNKTHCESLAFSWAMQTALALPQGM